MSRAVADAATVRLSPAGNLPGAHAVQAAGIAAARILCRAPAGSGWRTRPTLELPTMPKPRLDPIRARNLGNDYAKWLLQERRERTNANGKLFARLHTTRGRRFHGFTEEQVCTLIGVDFHG